MKLYGKKALALVMAVTMMLSLCCINVNAAGKPTDIEIKGGQETMGVGEVLELSIDLTPSNASKSVTWKSSDKKIATVSTSGKVTGKKAGEVTITVTAKSTSPAVEDTIVIEVKDVVEIEATDITVGYGTALSTAKAILNAQNDVKLYYGDGTDEYYEGKYEGAWKAPTSYNKGKTYGTFTFEVDDSDLEGTVDVTVDDIDLKDEADATLDPIYIPKGTKYSSSLLPDEVSLQLNNSTTETTLSIGSSKSDNFEPWDGEITSTKEKFEEVGTYNYTTTLRSKDNWAEITLIQPVEVYDNEVTDIELDARDGYIYMDDAADYINVALEDIFGDEAELHHIDITKITGEKEGKDKPSDTYISGTLYTDSDCDTKVDEGDDAYTAEEFDEMCFVANGKGNTTVVEYTAYADEDGKQALKGTIYIESEEFMILEMEVSNSDILDFSSGDFSSAFKALDKDNTLEYVVFDNELYSSEGELYYKYDTKNEETVDDEEFYVKANTKDDEWDLDDVSFVPDEDAKGIITIEFTAYGYYDDDEDDEIDATGVIQINVLDEADIVITAGIGEKVLVDLELFEEYLDDEVDTDDIAYIVFDGAPYTTTSGYLVSGSESFKSSGDKVFHIDPDRDEYDLEELYFVGGSSKGTKRADFEIYYYDDDEVEDDPVTGTVDFVTGTSTNIYTNYPLKASTVLKFSDNIDAFEKVGEQESEYFKFTSLPKGGKLYYNYGMSNQEDVTIGTAYYLGNVSGKKLLKNITFVPSYSSAKQQQVITFDYKAYDEDDNYVAGSCFFEVAYANKSEFFPDITTAIYADSVDFLKNQKITEGVPGGKYDAAGSLTRAQVVTFLYRAAGSPTTYNNSTTTFKDIVKGEYYYNAVLWASKTGVTAGRSTTVFDPNATVTNAEVIQFMYNFDVKYLKHTSYTAASIASVTDYAQVGDWATTAVRWALGKGVLTPGYLYPTNVGTRGNIALYLHRMLTL